MPRYSYRVYNKSGDQSFVVKDLVDTNQPVWRGFIKGHTLSPILHATRTADGSQWGLVSIEGDNPKPREPMVKEIQKEGEEIPYTP